MSEENKNINGEEGFTENNEKQTVESESSAYKYSFERMYEDYDKGEVEDPQKKRKISLSAFIISTVALVLAAVMLTWSVCMSAYQRNLASIVEEGIGIGYGDASESDFADLDVLDSIFKTFSYYGLTEDEMIDIVLKSYVAATGDRYAEYFTDEEYEEYMDSVTGSSEGIGINIIYTTEKFDGMEYLILRVTNVSKDSPAMKAGVQVSPLFPRP